MWGKTGTGTATRGGPEGMWHEFHQVLTCSPSEVFYFYFYFFIMHMCIQCLGHFSPPPSEFLQPHVKVEQNEVHNSDKFNLGVNFAVKI
jgi:hypothetical protein